MKRGPRAPPRRRVLEPTPTRTPASRPPAPAATTSKSKVCGCEQYSDANIRQDNGQLVCIQCGTVIGDDVVVNDVTFREAPSGAVHVHGATIHAGQRFAKSAGSSYRHAGRTAEDAQESNLRYAKEEMIRLANSLSISNMVERAYRLYTIARFHQFHRPVQDSVAICLYIVCRQAKGNTILLIDFAEKIQQNVFDLGSVYKKFTRALGLENTLEEIPIMDIEPLLYRLAKRLEFGHYTRQVAHDAALILGRMKRDWIVTGRQPPALCGAALVLAARMNNFRRSVREVVYVVKAGDATIQKRLREFRRTQAGRLTVANFRLYAPRLKASMDPPSVYLAKELSERRLQAVDPDLEDAPIAKSRGRPSKRRAEDMEGDTDENAMVAALTKEIDEDAIDEQRPRKRRTRAPEVFVPLPLTEDDLLAEDYLEQEINDVVTTHASLTDEARYAATLKQATLTAEAEKARQREEKLKKSQWTKNWQLHKSTSDMSLPENSSTATPGEPSHSPSTPDYSTAALENPTIGPDEFDDDPEVSNCLLNEQEIKIKERIWVTANEDWLRAQQERALARALDEAMGKKKKRKYGGDGSTNASGGSGGGKRWTSGENIASRGSSEFGDGVAGSAAEANARMLERKAMRPAFSRHINYEKLKRIYRLPGADDDGAVVENAANDDDDEVDTSTAVGGDNVGKVEPNVPVGSSALVLDREANVDATPGNLVENVDEQVEEEEDDEDEGIDGPVEAGAGYVEEEYEGEYDDGEALDYNDYNEIGLEDEEYFD